MKIYFDMDGVLANFNAMRPNDKDLNHPSKDLSPEKRAAKKVFWQEIEKQPNFWRDIPIMAILKYNPEQQRALSVFGKIKRLFNNKAKEIQK